MKFKIRLESAIDAQEFVNAATKCGADVDLHSGVVYIDGKSLLGVLAMGISRELSVVVQGTSVDPTFKEVVNKFAIA